MLSFSFLSSRYFSIKCTLDNILILVYINIYQCKWGLGLHFLKLFNILCQYWYERILGNRDCCVQNFNYNLQSSITFDVSEMEIRQAFLIIWRYSTAKPYRSFLHIQNIQSLTNPWRIFSHMEVVTIAQLNNI